MYKTNFPADLIGGFGVSAKLKIYFSQKQWNSYFPMCLAFALADRKCLRFEQKPASTTLVQRLRQAHCGSLGGAYISSCVLKYYGVF